MISLKKYDLVRSEVRSERSNLEHTLTLLGAKWINENYGIRLRHNIGINARLTRTMGRVRIGKYGIKSIELSEILILDYKLTGNSDKLMEVLRHELIHYALYELGKPFMDEDDYFIQECKRLNASLGVTGLTRLMHEYTCTKGHRIIRANKLNTDLYNCGCGSDLNYQGKTVKKQ